MVLADNATISGETQSGPHCTKRTAEEGPPPTPAFRSSFLVKCPHPAAHGTQPCQAAGTQGCPWGTGRQGSGGQGCPRAQPGRAAEARDAHVVRSYPGCASSPRAPAGAATAASQSRSSACGSEGRREASSTAAHCPGPHARRRGRPRQLALRRVPLREVATCGFMQTRETPGLESHTEPGHLFQAMLASVKAPLRANTSENQSKGSGRGGLSKQGVTRTRTGNNRLNWHGREAISHWLGDLPPRQ